MKFGAKIFGNVWFWIILFFASIVLYVNNSIVSSELWKYVFLLSNIGLIVTTSITFKKRKWFQAVSGSILILSTAGFAFVIHRMATHPAQEIPRDLSLEKFKLTKHELLSSVKNWSCVESFDDDSTAEQYFRVDSILETKAFCGKLSAFFVLVATNAQGNGCTSFATWYTNEGTSWKRKMDFGSIGHGGSISLVDFSGDGQNELVIYGGVARIGWTQIFACDGDALKKIFEDQDGYRRSGYRVAEEDGKQYLVNFQDDRTVWWCEACAIYFGEPFLLQGTNFVRQPDAYADLAKDSNNWTSAVGLGDLAPDGHKKQIALDQNQRNAGIALLSRYALLLEKYPESSVLLYNAAEISKKIGDLAKQKAYQERILSLKNTSDPCRFCDDDDRRRRQEHLAQMKEMILATRPTAKPVK